MGWVHHNQGAVAHPRSGNRATTFTQCVLCSSRAWWVLPRSWLSRAALLSFIQHLHRSHQCMGLDFQNCGAQRGTVACQGRPLTHVLAGGHTSCVPSPVRSQRYDAPRSFLYACTKREPQGLGLSATAPTKRELGDVGYASKPQAVWAMLSTVTTSGGARTGGGGAKRKERERED